MIPPVIQRPCIPVFANTSKAPSLHTLKSLGLFDDDYNLLFTPSCIPPISKKGQDRWRKLLERNISDIKQSDYISGLAKTLNEKGIKIQTFLRGGYAAYVACVDEYFAFLVAEFLAFKGVELTIEIEEAEEPHDADLFDHLINNGIPATATHDYGLEFLKGLFKDKIPLLQKLIPETSPLFPYPEDYVLFTVGDEDFQTDRIIGRLNHPYLFTRDDIRIEIIDNKICMPESAGDFWQMVLHRSLKVVKTEPWHEMDFRAGLAALQLMHDGHVLITDACPLEKIFRYAVSTGSDKIYSGAVDRAKLHCKKSSGFLLSAYIAYAHAGGNIPTETPLLPSLYKLALLSTCYNTSYTAYWESGFLVLHWNCQKLVFPKDFTPTSTDDPFFDIAKWAPISCSEKRPLCHVLDGELSHLERVLFELALQKRMTPLSESMKDALVEYLIQGKVNITHLLQPWIPTENTHLGWIKALLTYSFKHGLRLWNSLNRPNLEEVFSLIAWNYPSYSYNLINTDRVKLLKLIAKSPKLELELAKKIADELIALNNPAHFPTIDSLIIDEDWFFSTKPTQERVEAVYLRTKNLNFLLRGITLPLLQKYKKAIPTETYIQLIKQFSAETLAKEWIHDFPLAERPNQAVSFFSDYTEKDRPLLDAVCSLPGIVEKNLIEKLHLLGLPVFAAQSFSKLFHFLKSYPLDVVKNLPQLNNKEEASLLRWMKENPDISLQLLAHVPAPLAVRHLLAVKSIKIRTYLPHADPNELLPFFQDRAWVRSVYGIEANAKTKEWARLTKTDSILSRTELANVPTMRLKVFLEHYTGTKLSDNTQASKCFDQLVNLLLNVIAKEEEYNLYRFGILSQLFKIGLEAKLYPEDPFSNMARAMPFVPVLCYETGTFDPLLHLLQTLPPIHHESEEVYNQWNIDRSAFLDRYRPKGTSQLQVTPYSTSQLAYTYAYQFKLITEQYIVGSATKKEFQEEVLALTGLLDNDLAQFQPHEDPCTVCINDLLFFLKLKDKRARAYEAFNYLIQKRTTEELQYYLKTRQNLEDYIHEKASLLHANKITYFQFFDTITDRIRSLFEANPRNFHIQDPIRDALETEPLMLIDKIELQKSWMLILAASENPYNHYAAAIIKSYTTFGKTVINDNYAQGYLIKAIAALLVTYNYLDPAPSRLELALIVHLATTYLGDESKALLLNSLKEKIGISIPY